MPQVNIYDIIIAGGGLAGQSLALQIINKKPDCSILLIGKGLGKSPEVTHTVGESTSELGSYYFHSVLGLRENLEKNHIRKFGFRFFFHSKRDHEIDKRMELGSSIDTPYPAYQMDRGKFENDLLELLISKNIEIIDDSLVTEIQLNNNIHRITVNESQEKLQTKWFVDASGRAGILKKKLGLNKNIDHNINASWFRINKLIDVDDWSDNIAWKSNVRTGMRWRSTNHLMGNGYWIWLIPIVNGNMSIGIVADPRIHDPKEFNTLENALNWIKTHEPHAYSNIKAQNADVLDFKHIQNFSYGCDKIVSNERWAITGDAGNFLDPLYSPGSDFIALNNTWISDLICRDLEGEDIQVRALTYNFVQDELVKGWLSIYQNKYLMFGNTQITLFKIVWDWATYWSFPCLIYMNSGYTDITFLKKYASSNQAIGQKFAALNERLQMIFDQSNEMIDPEVTHRYINTFDISFLKRFHLDLSIPLDREELIKQLIRNIEILEQVWACMFLLLSKEINNTSLDMPISPYKMHLGMKADELKRISKEDDCIVLTEEIKQDICQIWLVK